MLTKLRKLTSPCLLVLLVLGSTAQVSALEHPALDLGFEQVTRGLMLKEWGGGPRQTIGADSMVVHQGAYSAVLTRDETSPGEFSSVTEHLVVDYEGRYLTLRAYLRTEDAAEAQLWMRQDKDGVNTAFANMNKAALTGTLDWQQYEIHLVVDPAATDLYIGALVSGTGKLWVDDVELLIDGVPYAETPVVLRNPTVLDSDTEFDRGSGLEAAALSRVPAGNLVLLGKVWGFLKYHHPTITGGHRNWDFELFRFLPEYLQHADLTAARSSLVHWIEGLGALEPCSPCAEVEGDWHLRADLDWLEDEDLLGASLSALLHDVYGHRPADGEQFYVGLAPNILNPDFGRELGYADLRDIDAGFRLLALYRFWNIIEYWSPYRDVIGEDWDDVLREFVPRLVQADSRDAYVLELIALIARVNDTHAGLWSSWTAIPPAGEAYLPFSMRFLHGQAVVTAVVSDPAGGVSPLCPGDVVLAIDGRDLDELIAERTPYYAASNQPTRLRDMARLFPRGPSGPGRVTVRRGDDVLRLDLIREPLTFRAMVTRARHDRPGDAFQRLSDEIAYLKFSSVTNAEVPSYLSGAEGARGLILDLRNYPSEFLVFSLGSRLVGETTPFVVFTQGDLANPGCFTWSDPRSLEPQGTSFPGKIAILVDETTQSSAEYHALAFRAVPDAVVIGSTTAGADGNVSRIELPGGEYTMISGIGIFYPDRTPTQRVGIGPDQVVVPTRAGIAAGRDEVLEAAVRHLLGREVSEQEMALILKPR